MGRGGLRLGKQARAVPPTRKPRAADKVDRLIQEGLRRASRLADDAVGTRAKTRGTRKLWRPYDPGNKRVVTTQDARKALRSVGVDVSLEELKSVTGGGELVKYDALRRAPSPQKQRRGRTTQRTYGRRHAEDAERRLVSRMASSSEVAPLRVALRRRDMHRSGHLAPRDFVRAIQAHYGAETLEKDEANALCAEYGPSSQTEGVADAPGKNHTEDSDAVKATLHHNDERASSRHFEATHAAVDYERFLDTIESQADSKNAVQAAQRAMITPAPPDHPPPVDEPPYARPDDHSAISLREPPSPSGPDVMETAAGRRAVREVARVLDDETVRERWLRDCKGPVETVDAARVMLQSCGARLTSTEADAAVALGVIDGEFCGRRLARRCMAAADRVQPSRSDAPRSRAERHERLALERAAQAVARASGCLDARARREASERIARASGSSDLPVPSPKKVAFALRQHHVLSDADADALALAAAKRAQTVPLAEALHAVLFRGKDAAVSEADPKPQGPRAILPLNADDAAPTTIISLARAPAASALTVRPEHRAAEANIAAALERLANAPCPTFFSRTEPNPRAIRKGFGQCRQRDSVIWCLDAPSVETYVEPLYPAGLDVSGQVRFNRGLGRKRRSRSEPPRRFSTTYGDMVAPPPKPLDAPAGQVQALPPPPPTRPPRPPRRRSKSCAPPKPIGVVLGLC